MCPRYEGKPKGLTSELVRSLDHETALELAGRLWDSSKTPLGGRYIQRLGLELGQRRQRPAGVVLTSSAATGPVNTIAAGSGIVQLAAGAEHMLAPKSDGTEVAWGYNL
jgi:hypothetical protein